MARRQRNVLRQLFSRQLRGGNPVQRIRDPNWYRRSYRRPTPSRVVPVLSRQQIARNASYNRWARSRGRPLRGRMRSQGGRVWFEPY